MTPAELKSIIDDNSSQLKYIYNRKLRQGIKLSGKMIVEIAIRPDGAVRNAKIRQSNMGDKSFEDDIVRQIKNWNKPSPPPSRPRLPKPRRLPHWSRECLLRRRCGV